MDRRRCRHTRRPRPTPVRRSPRRSTRVESLMAVPASSRRSARGADDTPRAVREHRLGLIVSPIPDFGPGFFARARSPSGALRLQSTRPRHAPAYPPPARRPTPPLASALCTPPLLGFTRFADRGGCGEGRAPERLWNGNGRDGLDAPDVRGHRLPVPAAQRRGRRRQPCDVDAAHALLLRGRYAARPLAGFRRRRLRSRPASGRACR